MKKIKNIFFFAILFGGLVLFTKCSDEIYLEEPLKKEVQNEELQSKTQSKNSKEKKLNIKVLQ